MIDICIGKQDCIYSEMSWHNFALSLQIGCLWYSATYGGKVPHRN